MFLGSAKAIQSTGPGILLAYAIGGLMIFFIARALGELLLYRPVAGSFATYAEEFVGPWAGFVTGWSYWFMWVVIGHRLKSRLSASTCSTGFPIGAAVDTRR